MKYFNFNAVLFVSIYLFGPTSLVAQEINKIEPLTIYKSVQSENPLRYFHPADIGIPAGDLNGDGFQEFISHSSFSANLSTPELGDFIDKSLVCNYSDEGVRTECSIYEGGHLFPVGDLNNDGRDDLLLEEDGVIKLWSFLNHGDFDVNTSSEEFLNYDFGYSVTQVVPGHDLDGDDKEDLIISSNGLSGSNELCIIFMEPAEQRCSADQSWFDFSVGTDDFQVNIGDVIGDDNEEIVILHTSQPPYQLSVSVFSVDDQREITHESTTALGAAEAPAFDHRMYVANIDGDYKDDVIANAIIIPSTSRARELLLDSFFGASIGAHPENDTFIMQSIPGEVPFTQPRVVYSGNRIVQVSENIDGDVGIALANTNSLSICLGKDILSATEEPIGDACQNAKIVDQLGSNHQILENEFSPSIFTGINTPQASIDFLIGDLDRWAYEAGTRTLSVNSDDELITNTALNSLFDFFSEINNVFVTNPSPPEIPNGIVSTAEYFSRGFTTVLNEIGTDYNFMGEKEIVNITGTPSNVFTINDLVTSVRPGGVASFDFTVWFEIPIAEKDTATKKQQLIFADFVNRDYPFPYLGMTGNNIGDYDGDGYDDLLLGARYDTYLGEYVNRAWLFRGAEVYDCCASSEHPDIILDFNQDTTAVNGYEYLGIGTSIEPLGDIDGDGYDDFGLGLPNHYGTGAVYVYHGEAGVPKSMSEQADFEYPDLILRPRVLDGQTVAFFGSQISAGDFDGDGTVDIAVTSDSSFGSPAVPTIQIFTGGPDLDGEPDIFLSATKSSLGGTGDEIVSGTSGSSIQFLPKEEGKTHQDILFTAGNVNEGYTDAVIFEGGAEADSIPDIQLVNPNKRNGFGFFNRSKPGVGDLNNDGFYDIILVNQADNEDAFGSSRAYVFSSSSIIRVSNEEEIENPLEYRLSQNYPNPFNPSTNIEFRLGKASVVTLKVYDVLGREVATLINNQHYQSGSFTKIFDASKLASGVYIYRLEAGGFTQTRKMVLVK